MISDGVHAPAPTSRCGFIHLRIASLSDTADLRTRRPDSACTYLIVQGKNRFISRPDPKLSCRTWSINGALNKQRRTL